MAHDVGRMGGMELAMAHLVQGLLNRGSRVTVVARRCELVHPRLRWIAVRAPLRPFVVAYPWFFVVGSLALRRHRAGAAVALGAIVLNRVDACVVQFCHHGYAAKGGVKRASRRGPAHRLSAWWTDRLSRLAERWCYRSSRTRRLVAVSRGVGAELKTQFPAMSTLIRVIPNGVDRDRFRPDPATRRRVRGELGITDHQPLALFVGGDWERKGLRFAIEGVARASSWRLLVVGGGDTSALRRLAREVGAGERVKFTGRVQRVERFYAAADALLLPSEYEALPLVVLEAAASALPLLVTRVNGVEDLLVHGENGWFIERDARVISERLARLRDPSTRRAMGRAARAAISSYDWDRVAVEHLELHRELTTVPPLS